MRVGHRGLASTRLAETRRRICRSIGRFSPRTSARRRPFGRGARAAARPPERSTIHIRVKYTKLQAIVALRGPKRRRAARTGRGRKRRRRTTQRPSPRRGPSTHPTTTYHASILHKLSRWTRQAPLPRSTTPRAAPIPGRRIRGQPARPRSVDQATLAHHTLTCGSTYLGLRHRELNFCFLMSFLFHVVSNVAQTENLEIDSRLT